MFEGDRGGSWYPNRFEGVIRHDRCRKIYNPDELVDGVCNCCASVLKEEDFRLRRRRRRRGTEESQTAKTNIRYLTEDAAKERVRAVTKRNRELRLDNYHWSLRFLWARIKIRGLSEKMKESAARGEMKKMV